MAVPAVEFRVGERTVRVTSPDKIYFAEPGLTKLDVVNYVLAVGDGISLFFDLMFVVVCVAAALAVRPRDFFLIGVFPPLLMAVTLLVLAMVATGTIADPRDGLIQAVVSGLAHHAGSLVAGYVLTLVVLALRNVAIRNAGGLRRRPAPQRRTTQPIS